MIYSPADLLAIAIVMVGIMLQAWGGLGFGLLAAPLLYLINPAYVPGPILILGFSLSVLMVIRERSQLRWRGILPAALARIPGSWFGALLLVSIPAYSLSLLFGVTLLLAVLLSWRTYRVSKTPLSLMIGGFFSGLIGTATSVGGPPIALVYQEQNRILARNELAAFFLIGTPASILMLALQDRVDLLSLELSLKVFPGVLLGFWLANVLDGGGQAKSAKPLILTVCSASAVMVLYKGLQGWLAA
ncbi:sulfite exporter TauE/SafE family protein [Motiliproteus coralliicola]|uniref:Probable membrane transporter protein n=1 Tax=Motiliproteus coralliicola TaxID=2283196 RepID=A0A369WTD9_9GAMM|nr:sulfite exporter TauE/SafE family protein [Motiliproteus coralliicola]RDE24851.1 sulfite exporter TauE/SafE family protein [Motiliproteus coralliicola]